jgi:hypothetical protein
MSGGPKDMVVTTKLRYRQRSGRLLPSAGTAVIKSALAPSPTSLAVAATHIVDVHGIAKEDNWFCQRTRTSL